MKPSFVDRLRLNLKYPVEYQSLFDDVEKAEQSAHILKNKDSFVKRKIDSCKVSLKGVFEIEDLVKEGLIEKKDIGEIVVSKTFALEGSLRSDDITARGPVAFEKNVVIGRSTILGPAYISEKSKIFDSRLRGGPGGSVYVGKNCTLWDFTVIIRSLIGNNSLIHTCNIDDSIVGPNCNFGATRTLSISKLRENKNWKFEDCAKLDQRIVLANYSYGSKIRIFDPTTDTVAQTEADHFGTLAGTRVWLASGTIIYPGTIIGSEAKINSTIPLIGYIPSKETLSLFLSIRKNKQGIQRIEPKGTLTRHMREYFTRERAKSTSTRNKADLVKNGARQSIRASEA